MAKPPLVGIVGPTASGKTALAVDLAQEFNGEIVSADSRAVYRGLDLGTAKPTREQRLAVPHHLIDVADPKETYTVAQFKEAAVTAIEHIQQRGKLPFLVGGTGLYVRAVVDNLHIPPVPPQPELRAELEALPLDQLKDRLQAADPISSEMVDLNNKRRVIRAIEVSETIGIPFSTMQKTGEPMFDALLIGILRDQEKLVTRISKSLQERWHDGLVDEVRRLHESGLSWEHLEAFGLEYRRVAEFLQDKTTEDEARASLTKDIEQFAKRQMTWFKRDERVRWITDPDDAEQLVSEWLVKRSAELV